MRLSVNVDHVATLRNARGGHFPCPVEAARICLAAGADGITIHLREDRRHIRDRDLERMAAELRTRLNLEMAATEEMVAICTRLAPPACCIVPEKRAELTTEGGLNLATPDPFLREAIARIAARGTEVSLFIEPEPQAVLAAAALGAQAVELHTGTYSEAPAADRPAQLARIAQAARAAHAAGLLCHAGHGLNWENVGPIAALPEIEEVSIGHFLIGAALFEGLEAAVRRMIGAIAAGRA